MAGSTEYDAIVLDVMLPAYPTASTTTRKLREDGVWSPVIPLTARDCGVEDRVAGLDGGADDYLTKLFSLAELLARLRALVRRGPVERPAVVEIGDLRLDPATHQVWRGETEISLSAKEFALLEAFMRRSGEALLAIPAARARLAVRRVRAPAPTSSTSHATLPAREDRHRPFDVDSIETVRGAGYRMRKDGS